MHIMLTPFEQKIMGIVEAQTLLYTPPRPFTAMILAGKGEEQLGEGWAGAAIYLSHGRRRFPLLQRFLGRLAKKGLVERVSSSVSLNLNSNWGYWQLTDQGRDFLGLQSSS